MNQEFAINYNATNDLTLPNDSNPITVQSVRNLSIPSGGAGDISVRSAIKTVVAYAGGGNMMIDSDRIDNATAAGGNLCLRAHYIEKVNLTNGSYQTIVANNVGDIFANGGGNVYINVSDAVRSVNAGYGDLELRAKTIGPVAGGNGNVSIVADEIGDLTTGNGTMDLVVTTKLKSLKALARGAITLSGNSIGAVDLTVADFVSIKANKIDSLIASPGTIDITDAEILKLSGNNHNSTVCLHGKAKVVDKSAYAGTIENCK